MTEPDITVSAGSLLGPDSEFEGKLAFLGTVRVEGRFSGEVRSEGTLVVAAGGEVGGEIDVGRLIVAGGVARAQVTAREFVEIHPGGRLIGTVITPSLQIEKGAVFDGTCRMPDEPEREDAATAANEPASG